MAKLYHIKIERDVSVIAESEKEAIAIVKSEYQDLGVNIKVEIFDEEEE